MSLKRFLIGEPLETAREKQERLNKVMGLAVFSSDALSSVAYGPEEIFFALVLGGTALLSYSIPVAIAIVVLVLIVASSYYQTIHAYPSGGGAYVVAKDNLGTRPGVVAGAALLIDYVLTVAVSICSGIAAITSAFPGLYRHRVLLCVIAIVLLTLVNLRGVRESGKLFSIPVYIFIASMFLLVGLGLVKIFSGQAPGPAAAAQQSSLVQIFPLFILLRAFASGCATLTGIEAISNGVTAFRPPESRNAGITLIYMALILAALALGITFVSYHFGALPAKNETMLSQIARMIFSVGPIYYVIQFSTAFILILAVNTSFAGFPRLSSIMASDGFLPRQLANLGDRLVFSNGILILGAIASLLVIIFRGNTHALIPLYAVGVFLGFTLSQAGMVRRWFSLKGAGWRRNALINGIGACSTLVVLIVITFEKFTRGAWMVVFAIPVLVWMSLRVKRHYLSVSRQLVIQPDYHETEFKHHSVIVPVSGVQMAVINAIKYAKALSNDVAAVYISLNPAEEAQMRADWEKYGMGVPLKILESPYRSITRPLLDYVDQVREKYPDGIITVLLPEFVPSKWWQHLLHNQTAFIIRGFLHFKPGVVIISVPLHLQK